MSAEPGAMEAKPIAKDETKTLQAAEKLTAGRNLGELTVAARHAVSMKDADTAMILLDGAERLLPVPDAVFLQKFIPEMTMLLGICWREKMHEPGRRTVELVLRLLADPVCAKDAELAPAVADYAQLAGRFVLRRRDDALFAEVAAQSAAWLTEAGNGRTAGTVLPVFEAWLHRILKHDRITCVPAIFAAMQTVIAAEADKINFLTGFLIEWRFVAATAALKPDNPLAVQLMEQLLLFALQSGIREFWPPVARTAGEAAALAVTRNGARAGFFMLRPLLDVGRVALGDELKFDAGAEPDTARQLILRLVSGQALRIANLAARGDMLAVAGDKVEELYQSWIAMPDYEPHRRSICRFCQMLLIVWAHHFKRAAKKWAPRESELSEPLLLSEVDQAKLAFLL